jgi:hypothetical protein
VVIKKILTKKDLKVLQLNLKDRNNTKNKLKTKMRRSGIKEKAYFLVECMTLITDKCNKIEKDKGIKMTRKNKKMIFMFCLKQRDNTTRIRYNIK